MRRCAGAVLLVAALVGCSSDSEPAGLPTDPPTSASSEATPSTPSTPSSPTESTDGRDLDVDELVVPPASKKLPSAWRELFVIGYGPGKDLLGTSPGGDSGTLDIGPEYGAPAPDGTWWFLDPAKGRLAHYDATGGLLDEVRVPRRLSVDGKFPWALPHVLADGTVVATRFGQDRTYLLRLRDGVLDEVPVDGFLGLTYDDGELLYAVLGPRKVVSIDPEDGSVERVPAYRTPSGTPFRLWLRDGSLRVDLPASDVSLSLPLRSRSGATAHVGVEVRAGADDSLHLFLYGVAEGAETRQLVGATLISPSGAAAAVEALPNPFSETDPGSPAHLVIAPGSSTPMLVYVLPDGVHVYGRTA